MHEAWAFVTTAVCIVPIYNTQWLRVKVEKLSWNSMARHAATKLTPASSTLLLVNDAAEVVVTAACSPSHLGARFGVSHCAARKFFGLFLRVVDTRTAMGVTCVLCCCHASAKPYLIAQRQLKFGGVLSPTTVVTPLLICTCRPLHHAAVHECRSAGALCNTRRISAPPREVRPT